MKRSYVIRFILVFVILFGMMEFSFFSAANTDIVITGFTQGKDKVKQGDEFIFTMAYGKYTDSDKTDLYLTVDTTNSAFYIASNEKQVKKLEEPPKSSKINEEPPKSAKINLVYKGTGNQLTLIFTYKKGASEEIHEITQTVYLDTYVKKESSGSNSYTDTKTLRPNLTITGDTKKPKGEAGKNMTIELPIKNIGSYSANNVVVSIESGSGDFPFTTNQISLSKTIDSIDSNDTETVSFSLFVKPYIKADTYNLKVNMQYSNTHGDLYTSSENVFVELLNNNKKPSLVLKSAKLLPELPVPGEKFNIFLELENRGTLEAEDVKISIKGFKDDGIIPGLTGNTFINSIKGGESGKVSYLFTVSKDINLESYPIEIELMYTDALNNEYKDDSTYYIPIKGKGSSKASIKIDNINAPIKDVYPDGNFKISFDLQNNGSAKASDVKVWLPSDKEIICKSLNTVIIDSLEAGGKHHLEFDMSVASDAITRNYPVALNIEYKEYENSQEKQTVIQYVGVPVEGKDSEDTGKSVPKIIIDRYGLSTSEVVAGGSFDVNLSFYNTHKNIATSNIKVSFSAEEGVFLPAANSYNSVYLEEIGAKTRIDKTLSFVAKFDAPSKIYLLNIDMEYEDDKGNAYTAKEALSIPVVQAHRLVTGELNVPTETFAGQPIPVMLEFYNMGKSTLNNLMVKYEGDMDAQNSNYFVGNFEPGRNDYFEVTVIPLVEGESKGSIVFSFEDSTGKAIEEREEFSVNVMPMMGEDMMFPGMEGMMDQGYEMPSNMNGAVGMNLILIVVVILVVVLLAIGLIVFIVIKKRRAAKAGKDLYENY